MALKMGHELVGPGVVMPSGEQYGDVGAGAGGAPVWAVGNPVAVAMAGLQHEVANFADTYDAVTAKDWEVRMNQELDQKFFHPETGLFYTRKGESAQGLYQELTDTAKDMWNERAQKDLSATQRGLIAKSFSARLTDYGHKVGAFETQELMEAQKRKAANTIYNLQNMVAQEGDALDFSKIAYAYQGIMEMNLALGRTEGWNEEFIVNKTKEETGKAIVNGANALGAVDPVSAMGAVESFREFIPDVQYQAVMGTLSDRVDVNFRERTLEEAEILGPKTAVENAWKKTSMARWAKYAKEGESAQKGSKAIGYDATGGTSYGMYQINSKMIPSFLAWLENNGNKEGAQKLRAAGDPDTGSTKGAFVDAWQELISNGTISDEDQEQYIHQTHVTPTLKRLNKDLHDRVMNNIAYGRVLFSTAVQHGDKQAAQILNGAWERSGGNDGRFMNEVFADRSTRFSKSSDKVKLSVNQRYKKELAQALADVGGEVKGMIEPGNIDLFNRPVVKMEDGSIATVLSTGMSFDGKEYLIPRVSDDGKILTEEEAAAQFKKTGKHLGIFDSAEASTEYGKALSKQQQEHYTGWVRGKPLMKPSTFFSVRNYLRDKGVAKSQEARRIMREDVPNALAFFQRHNDPNVLTDVRNSLELAGSLEDLREFDDMVNVARGLQPMMQDNVMQPPGEQMNALTAWIENDTTTTNAAARMKTEREYSSIIGQRAKEMQSDPMGYFHANYPEWSVNRGLTTPDKFDVASMSDEEKRAHKYRMAKTGVEWQKSIGMRVPKPLTKQETTELQEVMKAAIPAHDKFSHLLDVGMNYKELAEFAFRQANVHGGVNYAATVAMESGGALHSDAQVIAAIALQPDGVIFAGDEALKQEAFATAKDDPTYQYMVAASLALPQDVESVKQAQEYMETVAKAVVKEKQATDINAPGVMSAFNNVNEYYGTKISFGENFSIGGGKSVQANVVLRMPKNRGSVDVLAAGLGLQNDKLADILPQPQTRESLEAVKQRGIWLQTADDTVTFFLDRGVRALDANGNPVRIKVEDAIKEAEAAMRKEEERQRKFAQERVQFEGYDIRSGEAAEEPQDRTYWW